MKSLDIFVSGMIAPSARSPGAAPAGPPRTGRTRGGGRARFADDAEFCQLKTVNWAVASHEVQPNHIPGNRLRNWCIVLMLYFSRCFLADDVPFISYLVGDSGILRQRRRRGFQVQRGEPSVFCTLYSSRSWILLDLHEVYL